MTSSLFKGQRSCAFFLDVSGRKRLRRLRLSALMSLPGQTVFRRLKQTLARGSRWIRASPPAVQRNGASLRPVDVLHMGATQRRFRAIHSNVSGNENMQPVTGAARSILRSDHERRRPTVDGEIDQRNDSRRASDDFDFPRSMRSSFFALECEQKSKQAQSTSVGILGGTPSEARPSNQNIENNGILCICCASQHKTTPCPALTDSVSLVACCPPVKFPPAAGRQQRPTASMAEVMAGSPWETARRQGSIPVGAFPVQKALRQVGPLELDARERRLGAAGFFLAAFFLADFLVGFFLAAFRATALRLISVRRFFCRLTAASSSRSRFFRGFLAAALLRSCHAHLPVSASAAKALLMTSRYKASGSRLISPSHVIAFDTGSMAARLNFSSSESMPKVWVVMRSPR